MGSDTVLTFNKSPVVVRHLENLARYQKDKTFDYSGRTNEGEGRFTSGECPLFITSSAFLGTVKAAAKFNYTSAFMPYYPDVQGAPQNSTTIGGASLWVMGGKSKEEHTRASPSSSPISRRPTCRPGGTRRPAICRSPTRPMNSPRSKGYYAKNPAAEVSVKQMTLHPPTENSRGLRLGNLLQIRDVWVEEIEQALAGKKTAQAALDAAVTRGNELLRQFQRTRKVSTVSLLPSTHERSEWWGREPGVGASPQIRSAVSSRPRSLRSRGRPSPLNAVGPPPRGGRVGRTHRRRLF